MRIITDNFATIVCGLAITCLLALSLIFTLVRPETDGGEAFALIHYPDGHTTRHRLDQPGELRIEVEGGYNVLVFDQGKVSMADADCPRGDCTRQPAISLPGEQLVCLPHRLWVEIESQTAREGDEGNGSVVDLVAE